MKLKNFFTFQPEEILKRLQNYRKFLFVREPLTRLVSAFEDKLVRSVGKNYRRVYGTLIQKKYRANKTLISEVGVGTTFEEFVRYIIDTSKTDATKLDEHWAVVSQLCHPCLVR